MHDRKKPFYSYNGKEDRVNRDAKDPLMDAWVDWLSEKADEIARSVTSDQRSAAIGSNAFHGEIHILRKRSR